MWATADVKQAIEKVHRTLSRLVKSLESAFGDRASDYFEEPRAVARARDPTGQFDLVVLACPRKSSLTARETEVTRLIGRGLGNRGIAKRLGMRTKTVEKHVERVKTKWGVNTRAEIARYAVILLAKDL